LKLIQWSWALLKVEWRASQTSSISIHKQLLYLIASMAESLHLLIQFIRSYGLVFLFVIFCILRSKNVLFICLTMFLNFFQSSMSWEPILFQILIAIIVPPTFRPSNNVNSFYILWPQLFYNLSDGLYGILKWCNIRNSWCVDFMNMVDEHTNKLFLFIAIFDKCLFLNVDKFLKNGYTDCEGGMIGDKSPI